MTERSLIINKLKGMFKNQENLEEYSAFMKEAWNQGKWLECYLLFKNLVHVLYKNQDWGEKRRGLRPYLCNNHAIPWEGELRADHPFLRIVVENKDPFVFHVYFDWDKNIDKILPIYRLLSEYDCMSLARVMMELCVFIVNPPVYPENVRMLEKIIKESTTNFLLTIFDTKGPIFHRLRNWIRYFLKEGTVEPLERLIYLELVEINQPHSIISFFQTSLEDDSTSSLKLLLKCASPEFITPSQIHEMILTKGTKNHMEYVWNELEKDSLPVFRGWELVSNGKLHLEPILHSLTMIASGCRGGYPLFRYLCDEVSQSQLFTIAAQMWRSYHFVRGDWNIWVLIGSKLGVSVHYSVFVGEPYKQYDAYLMFLVNLLTRRLTCK